MALSEKALITETSLTDVADAIREKLGVNTTYLPSEMGAAIRSIQGAGGLIEKSVTANGVYIASQDNATGYSKVSVNVPAPTITTKTVTENGTYRAEDDGAAGYSEITVNVPTSDSGRCPRAEQTTSYLLQSLFTNFDWEVTFEKE